MLDLPPPNQLNCPVCKKLCKVTGGVDSLPNNLYVGHIIQLSDANVELNNIIHNGL